VIVPHLIKAMPKRFLHTADIHLDSPLRGLDESEGASVQALRGKGFAVLIHFAIASAKAAQLDRTCPNIGVLQLRSMIVG
jgi:hypothetical protein